MAAFPRSGRDAPQASSASRLRGLAARSAAQPHHSDRQGLSRSSAEVDSERFFDDAPSFGDGTAPRLRVVGPDDDSRSRRHRAVEGADDDLSSWTDPVHRHEPEFDPPNRGWVPEWSGGGSSAAPRSRPRRRRAEAAPPLTAVDDRQPSDDAPEPDWSDDDDYEPGGGPGFRAVRHRVDRWSERWVPEPIRASRSRLTGRASVLLTVVGVVAVLVAGWTWWSGRPSTTPVAATAEQAATPLTVVSSTPTSSSPPAPAAPGEIWVSVTGRVTTPGLYRLPGDARVADALTAAGGLIDLADLTGINLAQTLTDGQSVVVAEQGTAVDPAVSPSAAGPTGTAGPLNLNTADQAAFESLPGVGPVMAQAILTWRADNGPFTSVDQLQEISGIGPARFAQLAPLVTV